MNIYERINKECVAARDADATEIAERILRMCSKADLEPLLLSAIETAQRGYVRSEEVKFLSTLMDAMKPSLLPSVPKYDPSEFLPLLKRRIALGDGTATTWGLATLADHQARLAMLMAQRNGLTETIRRHEEAIRILEESGARCLAELAAVQEKAA